MTDIEANVIEMMAVLTEPTRIKILQLISSEGEMCAKNILPQFQITQPTLSHHLNLLLESNVLKARKDGRFVYYSVNKDAIESIRKLLDSFTEPPVVRTVKRTVKVSDSGKKNTPVLKKKTSVPAPKIVISSPDLDEAKKSKKKKKSDKKKKDKDKKKKK